MQVFRLRRTPWKLAACFVTISCDSTLSEYSERYEGMNKPLDLETEHLSPWGTRWGIKRRPRLRDKKKEALETQRRSLWEFCIGNPEEGLHYWNPENVLMNVLKRGSLSVRVPLRSWTVGRLPGSVRVEQVLWTQGFLSNGVMRVKPRGRDFIWDPENYVKERSVDGVLSSLGPLWETESIRLIGALGGERNSRDKKKETSKCHQYP